jgi:hypothetical protein
MLAIYLDKGQNARVEKVSADAMFIEKKSGYYTCPVDAIFRHTNYTDSPISILAEGRIVAVGDPQTEEDVTKIMKQVHFSQLLGKRVDVDSEWKRLLNMIFKNLVPIGLVFLFIGIAISIAQGGA